MTDVAEQLRTLWTGVLPDGEVTDDSDFLESGGSSIDAVYLAAGIQETFGVAVDAIEVVSHPRFADLSELVGARLANGDQQHAGR